MDAALVAARALVKISKKAQNASLTTADLDAIPDPWRGWVVPRNWRETPRRFDGRGLGDHPRLLASFIEDLGLAVHTTIQRRLGAGTVADLTTAVIERPLPAWALHLVASCGVWSAPVYGGARPRPAPTSNSVAGDALEYLADTLRAPAFQMHTTAEALKPPVVRSLTELRSSLSGVRSDPDLREPFARSLGPDFTEFDLWDLTLGTAFGRYTGVEQPTTAIAQRIAQAIRSKEFVEAGLCPEPSCSQQTDLAAGCSCWIRFCASYGVAVDPGGIPGNSTREAKKGQVALDLALWQITTTAFTVGGQGTRQGAAPTVAHSPEQLLGWAELGALIQLHNRRFQLEGQLLDGDDLVISQAAFALDTISDPVALELAVDISCAVIRAAMRRAPAVMSRSTLESLAHLSRTTAGALRELRRPAQVVSVLGPMSEWLQGEALTLASFRLLEARQDLQLALQRRHAWTSAQRAYQAAKEALEMQQATLIRTNGDVASVARKKALEIEEQLDLGRIGSQLLRAEELLRRGRTTEAEEELDRAERQHRIIDGTLARLELLALEVDAAETHGYLRSTPRWRIMPELMRYRTAVDKAIVATVSAADSQVRQRLIVQARGAFSRVEQLQSELALNSPFTERQVWELQRIHLVHALVDSEITSLIRQSIVVAEQGGDDTPGDYVLPMLRWAQTAHTIALRFGVDELDEAQRIVLGASTAAPRLPDLSVLNRR